MTRKINKIVKEIKSLNIEKLKYLKIIIKNFRVEKREIMSFLFYIYYKKKNNLKKIPANKYIKSTVKNKEGRKNLFLIKKRLGIDLFYSVREKRLIFLYNKEIINGIIIETSSKIIDYSLVRKINTIKRIIK